MLSKRSKVYGGLAAGVLALGLGAGLAPAALASTSAPAKPFYNSCEANGLNVLKLTLGTANYKYPVALHTIKVNGTGLVSGWLRDNYEPVPASFPLHGVTFRANGVCDIVVSTAYPTSGPDAGGQGVRTFSGVISKYGIVNGTYTETGKNAEAGTFSLVFPTH